MRKLSEIHIRDPFVLPSPAESRYYLYGTMGEFTWGETGVGFDGYTSSDLVHWEGPFPIFRPPMGFWADRNFWAPEVHCYQGRYYLFASFKAEGVCRGTQILEGRSPLGPFLPISARPVTPPDWECLDGTFYLSPEGDPWMIFCHEWVQVGDGEICAVPLTADLTSTAGDPVYLFRASQAPWVQAIHSKGRKGFVTDGPWMHRLPGGELLLFWSSFGAGGYTVGIARSPSGQVIGPWQQEPEPIYSQDGGHCMTFTDFEGNLLLSLHRPNRTPDERPVFIPLAVEELAR
ncbi:MAG TPA: glycoside hydrolase family 43 protein [Anaerolineaceae bacterium]